MLTTLYAYILRELLKTFALSVVTLTAIFTLAGGLVGSIKFEGVGPSDIFNILPMLLPLAITYTMPISALFAVTMVYGRLAADNELVACRAAGINVHWLFLPTLLLSVAVTLVIVFSMNVLTPTAFTEITFYVKRNLRDLAFNKLRQAGYVDYHGKNGGDRFVLTAQSVHNVRPEALIDKGFPSPTDQIKYFWVDSPCFLWIDSKERLNRYAVAEGGLCQFDTTSDEVLVTLYVRNAREFEAGRTAALIASQKIGPIPAPIRIPHKPNMVGLATLLQWQKAPWESPALRQEIETLGVSMRFLNIYREMGKQLMSGRPLELLDYDNNLYTLRAENVGESDRALSLFDLALYREIPDYSDPIRILAPRGYLRLGINPEGLLTAGLELDSEGDANVVEYNPRAADKNKPIPKDAYATPELLLPAEWAERNPAPSMAAVIDKEAVPLDNEILDKDRNHVLRELSRLQRKVHGEFHFRMSFALSNLVTILMGAILGVMFRGAHALSAFGLACIPFTAAMLMIMIGKGQIETDAPQVGILIVWAGLASLALVDAAFMHRGVPR